MLSKPHQIKNGGASHQNPAAPSLPPLCTVTDQPSSNSGQTTTVNQECQTTTKKQGNDRTSSWGAVKPSTNLKAAEYHIKIPPLHRYHRQVQLLSNHWGTAVEQSPLCNLADQPPPSKRCSATDDHIKHIHTLHIYGHAPYLHHNHSTTITMTTAEKSGDNKTTITTTKRQQSSNRRATAEQPTLNKNGNNNNNIFRIFIIIVSTSSSSSHHHYCCAIKIIAPTSLSRTHNHHAQPPRVNIMHLSNPVEFGLFGCIVVWW